MPLGKFEDSNAQWEKILPVVSRLLKHDSVNKQEWQNLFWNVHMLCIWDDNAVGQLLDNFKESINIHVKMICNQILSCSTVWQRCNMYAQAWEIFHFQCEYLPLPFSQLEQILCEKSNACLNSHRALPYKNSNEGIIKALLLQAWHDYVFVYFKDDILSYAIDCIESERCSVSQPCLQSQMADTFGSKSLCDNSRLIQSVCDSFAQLSVCSADYRHQFQRAYVRRLRLHYCDRASACLLERGPLEYLRYAERALAAEYRLSVRYLRDTAWVQEMRATCVYVLVYSHCDALLSECELLIAGYERGEESCLSSESRLDNLAAMFRLMDSMQCLRLSAHNDNNFDGARQNLLEPQLGGGDNNQMDADYSIKINGVERMLQHVRQYFIKIGSMNMSESASGITQDCEKFVNKMLELYSQFSHIGQIVFSNDARFITIRDQAFRHLMNDSTVFKMVELPHSAESGARLASEARCPELLANYCDMLLRRTVYSRRLTHEQIGEKLARVLSLLKYVSNKDVFMRYYQVHLTRRLLLISHVHYEREHHLLDSLRSIGMPADYVNRIARMFQDIRISEDMNSELQAFQTTSCDINFNVKILNPGAWNISAVADTAREACETLNLPTHVRDYVQFVSKHFRAKHSGRKLLWYHHVTTATISFQSRHGLFDLDVTTYQMVVLFCWNQRRADRISLEALHLMTQLSEADLKRTLWSLVTVARLRTQVLLYEPSVTNCEHLSYSTQFWINHDFDMRKHGRMLTSRARANLIGRLQLFRSQVRDESDENVLRLRRWRVQEALVKLMKMRRRAYLSQIQAEMTDILAHMFVPDEDMIIQQLDSLIENKYLTRSAEDSNMFIYIV